MSRLPIMPLLAIVVGVAAIGCTASTRGDRPLRLRILKTDRQRYRLMETVVYDVAVENNTQSPLLIPWSPQPIRRRDRPASGYRHASFALELVDTRQRTAVVGTYVLYGSPTVPGSLRELKPGQRVTVRLPAILSGSGFQEERNLVRHPTPGLRARARLSVYAPDDAFFRSTDERVSDNTVPISIEPTVSVVAEPGPDPRPPEIVDIEPRSASADVVLRLDGYRLGVDRHEQGLEARLVFINGDVRLNADLRG